MLLADVPLLKELRIVKNNGNSALAGYYTVSIICFSIYKCKVYGRYNKYHYVDVIRYHGYTIHMVWRVFIVNPLVVAGVRRRHPSYSSHSLKPV